MLLEVFARTASNQVKDEKFDIQAPTGASGPDPVLPEREAA
jgi:hypothetical protein